MTVKQALVWARQVLNKQNTSTPALDARLLLMHVAKLSQADLIKFDDRLLTYSQQQYFAELVDQRCLGVPIAYLLGQQAFWSLQLAVTPDVLIPRPDTECLVEWVLDYGPDQSDLTVLDVGTGSGAIALAVASERPCWTVIGSDASIKAVRLAQHNAQLNHVTHVSWVVSNWLAAYKLQPSFDIIVSNPPYVAIDDPFDETSGYEPEQALLAEDQGLAAIRHLAKVSQSYLKPGGCLLMEHGSQQGEAVRSILYSNNWQHVATFKDWSGLERASWGYSL